jgi:hypothetical protein
MVLHSILEFYSILKCHSILDAMVLHSDPLTTHLPVSQPNPAMYLAACKASQSLAEHHEHTGAKT